MAEEPPVLVDWLPWNHTFGGNHNYGIAMYNGGTLYIDDGKPMQPLMQETLRNLREISTNVYFNVPKGFEELVHALESDAQLREVFFRRLRLMFYAGAGLPKPVADRLYAIAEAHCGERVGIYTGLGMTETAPFAIGTVRISDVGRRHRQSCPGRDHEAGPQPGQARAALCRPRSDARLLACTRSSPRAPSTKKGSSAATTPCGSSIAATRAWVSRSTDASPRTSSSALGRG